MPSRYYVASMSLIVALGGFLIYGIFAAIGFVFIMILLPETKGRSLEELEGELVTKSVRGGT